MEETKFTVEVVENGYVLRWDDWAHPWCTPRSVYYMLEDEVATRIEEVLLRQRKDREKAGRERDG